MNKISKWMTTTNKKATAHEMKEEKKIYKNHTQNEVNWKWKYRKSMNMNPGNEPKNKISGKKWYTRIKSNKALHAKQLRPRQNIETTHSAEWNEEKKMKLYSQ